MTFIWSSSQGLRLRLFRQANNRAAGPSAAKEGLSTALAGPSLRYLPCPRTLHTTNTSSLDSQSRPDNVASLSRAPIPSKDKSELAALGTKVNIIDDDPALSAHLQLLERRVGRDELGEIASTPIFTEPVRRYALSLADSSHDRMPFHQYGLLAGNLGSRSGRSLKHAPTDPRLFWNISAPSSFLICGSQGSGKSHTLSCLLENALAPCKANRLTRPLTGIVFHYDSFVSEFGGSPCEAAWLSTNPDIKVRVLCPPSNICESIVGFPNIQVEELRLGQSDLNTKRMLSLMAVPTGGDQALYLHVTQRVLREMRIVQQRKGKRFNYAVFKQKLFRQNLNEAQLGLLQQRLEILESFMAKKHVKAAKLPEKKPANISLKPNQPMVENPVDSAAAPGESAVRDDGEDSWDDEDGEDVEDGGDGTTWTPQNGQLTIVDLSCPCVTPDMACSLFRVCLSLFLEQDPAAMGRVVALDEAHKYMSRSGASDALTQTLLETIRLQRHMGTRVIVSTQEPSVNPALLDLCSVTIVHRFTSPSWLATLRRHVAGMSSRGKLLMVASTSRDRGEEKEEEEEDFYDEDGTGLRSFGYLEPGSGLLSHIVQLAVGEALLFAPSAIVGVRKRVRGGSAYDVQRLAHGVLKVRIRNRTTADSGKSIMA